MLLTCHQHELSPKSVSNIDVLEIRGPVTPIHGQLYTSIHSSLHSPFQGPLLGQIHGPWQSLLNSSP